MDLNDSDLLPEEYYVEIQQERQRQIDKGYTLTQIATSGWDELEKTIIAYTRWAGQMQRMGSPEEARKRLMQIATICCSRMQVLDAGQ